MVLFKSTDITVIYIENQKHISISHDQISTATILYAF